MTTPLPSWPPRRTGHRTTAPYVAVPREPLDPARTGRRWVRRRARGKTADAAAAALDVARFDARQNSRHEDLAGDERGPAELGEWERIARLLADAAPGTVYDPDTDDVVRAELAADAAAATREAAVREAQRIAARADELQALRELGTLAQAEPRPCEWVRSWHRAGVSGTGRWVPGLGADYGHARCHEVTKWLLSSAWQAVDRLPWERLLIALQGPLSQISGSVHASRVLRTAGHRGR